MTVTAPERIALPEPPPAGARPSSTARWVRAAAVLLVVAQLVVRWRLVAGRDFYGDDFVLLHMARDNGLLSWDYLAYDYSGHFMPGGLLLAGLVERFAPLQWGGAALTLVGMQALASFALLRLLRVLVGDRPLLLVPLALGLFTPVTLGSLGWWAAALNSLPLQIGLACYLTEAVLAARTGRRRHAVAGTAVLALTFCFYIKAVLVPPVGAALAVLVLLRDGERRPISLAWRRACPLWCGTVLVTAVWAAVYSATRSAPPATGSSTENYVQTVWTGMRVLASGVVAGPHAWVGTNGAPKADLHPWAVALGGALLLLAFLWTTVTRRGALAVWALVVLETVAGLLLAAAGRGSIDAGGVLPLACRYFPAEAVLLPVAAALLWTLPPRRPRRHPGAEHRPRGWAVPAAVAVAALVAVVATQSTVRYARVWAADPSEDYLGAARESLAAAGPAPVLDQPVPGTIIWSLLYPANLVSYVLASYEDRPPIADWTDDLQLLDDDGHLLPAAVQPVAAVVPGPIAGCGWGAGTAGVVDVALDAPLSEQVWVVRLDYIAAADGTVDVALPGGDPVRAPVSAGLHSVFLRLTGSGPALQVSADPGLCVAGGVAGDMVAR
ncbi:hypothetical protein [Blastococcus sp. URHD0036]|uniref:hypothetical protein n=1 Tax=Blastococcus sp. URHD0036 TaxID=1380356 RepID=UPI00068C7407|nr:hypothetical protein [Blastococcus sp. URHD0036]